MSVDYDFSAPPTCCIMKWGLVISVKRVDVCVVFKEHLFDNHSSQHRQDREGWVDGPLRFQWLHTVLHNEVEQSWISQER